MKSTQSMHLDKIYAYVTTLYSNNNMIITSVLELHIWEIKIKCGFFQIVSFYSSIFIISIYLFTYF